MRLGIVLTLLFLTSPLSAVTGEWRALGPDGGSVYALAASAADPRVLYASVEGRVYRSGDGGASWVDVSQGFDPSRPAYTLAAHPLLPGTVYREYQGFLYKTENGGAAWVRQTGVFGLNVLAAIHPRTGATIASASGSLYRQAAGGSGWSLLKPGIRDLHVATALAFDPTSPNVVYAGAYLSRNGAYSLFKSVDGGKSWSRIDSGPLTGQNVLVVTVDPQAPRTAPKTIYAGTAAGLFKSTNGGRTWRQTGYPPEIVFVIEIDPADRRTLYAGGRNGLYHSTDGGANWLPARTGLPGTGEIRGLEIVGQMVLAGVAAETRRGGVFASVNGGATWALRSRGISGLRVSSVAVDSQVRGTLWVTAAGVLFKSTDRGLTWGRVRTDAVGNPLVSQVAIDPRDSSTVYALLADGGLRRTRDGGASWEALATPDVGAVVFAVDPEDSSTLYAAGTRGMMKSTDAGASWFRPLADRISFFLLAIAPSDGDTVYAAGRLPNQARFLRSADAGATWTRLQPDPRPFVSPNSFAVDAVSAETVYVHLDGQLYRSENGGAAWTARPAFPLRTAVLAASPHESRVLYAAVTGVDVYESQDGGETWEALGKVAGFGASDQVAPDPLDPCRIYVATRQRGLLAFTKSGEGGCPGE